MQTYPTPSTSGTLVRYLTFPVPPLVSKAGLALHSVPGIVFVRFLHNSGSCPPTLHHQAMVACFTVRHIAVFTLDSFKSNVPLDGVSQ